MNDRLNRKIIPLLLIVLIALTTSCASITDVERVDEDRTYMQRLLDSEPEKAMAFPAREDKSGKPILFAVEHITLTDQNMVVAISLKDGRVPQKLWIRDDDLGTVVKAKCNKYKLSEDKNLMSDILADSLDIKNDKQQGLLNSIVKYAFTTIMCESSELNLPFNAVLVAEGDKQAFYPLANGQTVKDVSYVTQFWNNRLLIYILPRKKLEL